jgi:biopolymer transport protein ExbD
MSHKVKVDLPQATLKGHQGNADRRAAHHHHGDDAGNLYWNDQPTTKDQIESKLSVEAQKTPQPSINVRGDKDHQVPRGPGNRAGSPRARACARSASSRERTALSPEE